MVNNNAQLSERLAPLPIEDTSETPWNITTLYRIEGFKGSPGIVPRVARFSNSGYIFLQPGSAPKFMQKVFLLKFFFSPKFLKVWKAKLPRKASREITFLVSLQIEANLVVVTIFLLVVNQTEIYDRSENFPFDYKPN